MKDLCKYGNRPEVEWEILPWIPDPRPPFKIWVKPEQIAPFFLVPHHPYAISLLLKISDGWARSTTYPVCVAITTIFSAFSSPCAIPSATFMANGKAFRQRH